MPAPALLAAAPAIAQTAMGLGQALFSGKKKARRAYERSLDESPQYQESEGINRYYNEALQRYNVNPTESALYKRQQRDIGRGVARGLNALRDRRSALGGVSGLVRGSNDAMLNANVAAEQEKNKRFQTLGGASNMKAGEERMAFNTNKMQPYLRKLGMLRDRFAGATGQEMTGIANVYGGLESFANADGFGMFGNRKKGGSNSTNYTMSDLRNFRNSEGRSWR